MSLVQNTYYKSIRIVYITFILLTIGGFTFAKQSANSNQKSIHLFSIERSRDTQIVCYDISVLDNKINKNNPLSTYWTESKNHNIKEPLTFIQRNYSYGTEIESVSKDNLQFKIKALPEYSFLVEQKDKEYDAITTINGKTIKVATIYISFTEGSNWKPDVDYIEIHGINKEDCTVFKTTIKGNNE